MADPPHRRGDDVEIRFVQPYEATKAYLCPGCHQEIPPRTHHVVVVPTEAPELRRHWHSPCWRKRDERGPTGRRR